MTDNCKPVSAEPPLPCNKFTYTRDILDRFMCWTCGYRKDAHSPEAQLNPETRGPLVHRVDVPADRPKLNAANVAKSIAHTIENGSKKLTENQFMCLARSLAVYLELAQALAKVDVPADVRPERVLMMRRLQGPTDLCENEWYPWQEVFGPDMTIRQPETYEYAWFILQTSVSPILSAPASPSHPDTK